MTTLQCNYNFNNNSDNFNNNSDNLNNNLDNLINNLDNFIMHVVPIQSIKLPTNLYERN